MKKYQIIYADPPWNYRNYNYPSAIRGQEKEYSTMTLADIKALPVSQIVDEDALLFLWGCFPILPSVLEVIDAWKFKYYTLAFIWIKTNRIKKTPFWGMGNWTRSNAEPCLLGIKGKPIRISASVHSVVISPLGRHSQKPVEVRNRIIELCGDLPRIELFARKPDNVLFEDESFKGWDVWGNEVESDIELGDNK